MRKTEDVKTRPLLCLELVEWSGKLRDKCNLWLVVTLETVISQVAVRPMGSRGNGYNELNTSSNTKRAQCKFIEVFLILLLHSCTQYRASSRQKSMFGRY